MAKLNSEVKEMLAKQLAIVATASKDGMPNVGPKGSLYVVDDETLVYSESTEGKTLTNIFDNPKVAVIVFDRERAEGYQIKGEAELLTSGVLFEEVSKRQQQREKPIPRYAVKISIVEVYAFKSGVRGKRIA